MGIKGYKVFNSDWTCKGFQYEVGKTFKCDGNIESCGKGFHFCQKASDCFNYYRFDSNKKVAEVEAVGLVETQNDKSVTNEIKIIREIEWAELLTIVNEGKDCTGFRNTGNRNTGDWNSTSFSSGFFNSEEQELYFFNKPTSLKRNELSDLKGLSVLRWNYENSWWIYSENMTDEEKTAHPEYETTGGYLKTVDFKTACRMMWERLDDGDKQAVKELPNFDAEVFEEITGIKVER